MVTEREATDGSDLNKLVQESDRNMNSSQKK